MMMLERARVIFAPPRQAILIGLAALALLSLCTLASRRPVVQIDLRFVEGQLSPLAERLALSEHIWRKSVRGRQRLIERWGPRPKDVLTFPRDPPWPAYTLWDFFPPSFSCPWELERLGAPGDGGKWVCGFSRIEKKAGDCVVFSVGINTESSFEAEILERAPHCQVYGFDFSVERFGPELDDRPDLLSRAHFAPYGLAGHDAPDATPPMFTLPTLMRQTGHTWIDILKIDVESWEFVALRSLLDAFKGRPLPFGQLQLEIHTWDKSFPEVLDLWTALEDAGLRPFMQELNAVYTNYNRERDQDLSEYSFINVGGRHELISDMNTVSHEGHGSHPTAA